MASYKEYLKHRIPEPILSKIRFVRSLIKEIYFFVEIRLTQFYQKRALKKIKIKSKIRVAFFLIHEAVWKYELIYRLFEKDDRFEPIVVVCPVVNYGDENMRKEMNRAYSCFKKKKYNVVKSLDEDTGQWLNVKKTIRPDIVFFTNPWRLTKDIYYIDNFTDILTCYVPYFFHVTKHLKENYAGRLQNLSWKVFYETEIHLKYAKKYSHNKASNVSVTGYPGLDHFFKGVAVNDPWKIQDHKIKRIIWAPHHTIPGQDAGLKFSNFEKYAYFFLELAEIYFSKIQIAFKPHPLLKPKLFRDPNWGEKKTNMYYDMWDTLENGLLVEGEYKDLFLTSDAIIHDSGSFTVEYLTTLKPAMYVLSDINQTKNLNDFGKKAVNLHYKAFNKNDIEKFIVKTVIQGNDPMAIERIHFVNKYLVPPNHKTASENVFDNILKLLQLEKG